jgi:glutamate synthase domain-containing protein 3
MTITAGKIESRALNEQVKAAKGKKITIEQCFGQRFIGAGMSGRTITINGTPGNAMGAYLDGATINVNGNVQDAVGDTMNDGTIVIKGSAGDALGYAMRGGKIFVQGDSGYRTGIHMKAYQDKVPAIVIGGRAGSFLGEYQAGGILIVLGLGVDDVPVGNFAGTGMHGGKIFIRTNHELQGLPKQVTENVATAEDLQEIKPLLEEFAKHFEVNAEKLIKDRFYVLNPNAKNPYKQLYTSH